MKNSNDFVSALIEAMSKGAQLYWAHGDGCPKKYNLDTPIPCACGMDSASEALDEMMENADEPEMLIGERL